MGSSATMSSLLKLGLVLAVALLVAVPVALAAEETEREKYVATVEPICKANSDANASILKGVKGQVQQDKLVPAGKRFRLAARINVAASATMVATRTDLRPSGPPAGRRQRQADQMDRLPAQGEDLPTADRWGAEEQGQVPRAEARGRTQQEQQQSQQHGDQLRLRRVPDRLLQVPLS